MTLGEVLLRSTLITMAPSVFQKTYFKGYFSQSQNLNCPIRFLGSGTGPWTQTSWEGTISDAEHDDQKIFWVNLGINFESHQQEKVMNNKRMGCSHNVKCSLFALFSQYEQQTRLFAVRLILLSGQYD